jgi:AcrR family transcriptional regulator
MAAKPVQRLPRGRHGLPRQFVVESQRQRMLDALAEAVAEKGYGPTAVADVLERAGVSRRTFYEHFRDKLDCFLAAYDEAMGQLTRQVLAAYRGHEDWRDGVEAGIAQFVRALQAEPAFARVCIVEALAAGPEAIERRDAALRIFMEFFARVAPRTARPEDVPDLAGEAIVGAIHAIAYSRIVRDQLDELDELIPELTALALRFYPGGTVPRSGRAAVAPATPGRRRTATRG